MRQVVAGFIALIVGLAGAPAPGQEAEEVDVQLVLAIDSSSSVTPGLSTLSISSRTKR